MEFELTKKIFIASDTHGIIGGITRINEILFESLIRNKYDVSFISLQKVTPDRDIIEFNKLKKYTSKNGLASLHPGPLKSKLIIKKLLVPIWRAHQFASIVKFLASAPSGSVLIFSMTDIAFTFMNNLLFRKIIKRKNIKTIYQFHNNANSPYVTDQVIQIGNLVDVFVTLSKDDSAIFSKQILAKTVSISNPSPSPIEDNNFLSRPKQISVISRISPEKNIITIVDAFDIASRQFPDWSLNVYGSGEDTEKLVQHLQKLNNPRINYEGVLSTLEVTRVLKNSRLLAMASFFEGMPVALLEAASAGTPCISNSSSYAVTNFIESTNGFLTESNRVEDYTKRLLDSLNELSYSDERSFQSLDYSKNNSIEGFTRAWISIID